jgi:hypothetical protein
MRPELPTAVAVDNSASIQPARSIFISWGKSVQISGATSSARPAFLLVLSANAVHWPSRPDALYKMHNDDCGINIATILQKTPHGNKSKFS